MFECFYTTGETMTENEKLTVLSFDETYLSKTMSYEKKREQIWGPHKCVQVVMARGIISPWKQPIYYNFDEPMTKEILFEIIQSLERIGYKV